MPSTINGCGTKWYGKSLEESDGSYVVTEWITFLWVPLIPLGSKRVIQIDESEFRVKPTALHWPHVLLGYIPLVALSIIMSRH
jgi:hypothetical protein